MDKSQRVIFFDIFRIFALSLVIFSHLAQYFHYPIGNYFGIKDFYYITLGGFGVTLFLILSGMVLGYSYSNKIHTTKEYFTFFINRAKRIYVPFWIAIIVTLLITSTIPTISLRLFLDTTNLLVFTGGAWIQMIIPPAWFLGVILVFYLLFPLIDYLFNKYNIHFVLFFLLIIEITSRLIVGNYFSFLHRPLDWFVLCRIFEFGLGIWIIKSGIMNSLVNYRPNKQILAETIVKISALSFPFYLIHYGVLYSPLIYSTSKKIIVTKFFAYTILFAIDIYYLDRIINKSISTKTRRPVTPRTD